MIKRLGIFGPINSNKQTGMAYSIPNLFEALANNKLIDVSLYNINDFTFFKLIQHARKVDYIHLNSFYIFKYLCVIAFLKNSTNVFLCPRAATDKGTSAVLKKQIYYKIFNILIRLRCLNLTIHYLTEEEKNRSFYNHVNSIVLPNTIIEKYKSLDISKLKRKYKNKKIVFIGRVVIKRKGIDRIFEWVSKYRKVLIEYNWNVEIYGPLTDAIPENLDDPLIKFMGPIVGKEKDLVVDNATLGILISRSEGFPMAILEMWQASTPTIISKETGLLTVLEKSKAGIGYLDDCTHFLKIEFEEYFQFCEKAWFLSLEYSPSKIGFEFVEKLIHKTN
jgi:hypothetical protein